MALLQTWQQVWRRGCAAQCTGSGLYGVKEKRARALYLQQHSVTGGLSDIIFKLMLPSNKILLRTVLPSNKISLWEETAESLVWRSRWLDCCNRRTLAAGRPQHSLRPSCPISALEPQIPSRCGDVIASHSAYHRATQRAHGLVPAERGIVAVESGSASTGFLLQQALSVLNTLTITLAVIPCCGGEWVDATMSKCFCQLIFCQQDFLSTGNKLF